MIRLLLYSSLVLLLASCQATKRVHRKGYHLQWTNTSLKIDKSETKVKNVNPRIEGVISKHKEKKMKSADSTKVVVKVKEIQTVYVENIEHQPISKKVVIEEIANNSSEMELKKVGKKTSRPPPKKVKILYIVGMCAVALGVICFLIGYYLLMSGFSWSLSTLIFGLLYVLFSLVLELVGIILITGGIVLLIIAWLKKRKLEKEK